MNIIRNTPVAISGLLLAILSLGNLLNVRIITFPIALIILLLLFFKCIFYSDIIRDELSQLVVLSTSGTFSMALMLFSTYILSFNYYLALCIWVLGVVLHALLIIVFTYKYVLNDFNVKNVFGSYWVVYVGITMATISGSFFNFQYFTWIFFEFSFMMMLVTFPVVTYRYVKYPVDVDVAKPLICIYTALFSILIVSYVNSFSVINIYFLFVMYTMACICYVFSLYNMICYLKLPFYPSYSAFTFPFVISAVASNTMFNLTLNFVLGYVTLFETMVAVIMVVYVLIRYLQNIIFEFSEGS